MILGYKHVGAILNVLI